MKIEKVKIKNYKNQPIVKVYKNPQKTHIQTLIEYNKELRGIIDFNNGLYLWYSQDVTHIDIINNFDIFSNEYEYLYIKEQDNQIVLYIYDIYLKSRIKNHPKIKQALNQIYIKSIKDTDF